MAKLEERWDFRVAPEADRLVRQAADATDRTLTAFVVDAAVVEAQHLLADRRSFEMAAPEWARFVEMLDQPPRDMPGLEKLFAKPSVFSAE